MPYKIEGTTNTNADLVIMKEDDWSVEKTMEVNSESAYLAKPLVSGTKVVFGVRPDGEMVGYGDVSPVFYEFEYPRVISESAMFNDNDTEYLSRSPSVSGDTQAGIFSTWYKFGNQTSQCLITGRVANLYEDGIVTDASGQLIVYSYEASLTAHWKSDTETLFRDPTSWYNIVVAFDYSNSTAADRIRVYVNGLRVSGTMVQAPGASDIIHFNKNTATVFIGQNGAANQFMDGYMSETIWLDGQTITDPASLFGEFYSGSWVPKSSLSLTYGTTGFYLDFANSGDLGNDISGNNNDFTESGTPLQVTDSPTNNFATLNAIEETRSAHTFAEGNLRILKVPDGVNDTIRSTLSMSSGKWYWEVYCTLQNSGHLYGIIKDTESDMDVGVGNVADGYAYVGTTGHKVNNGVSVPYGDTWVTGEVISILYDADNGDLKFWNQGVDQGTSYSGLSGTFLPGFGLYTQNDIIQVNFGNPSWSDTFNYSDENGYGSFKYQPPAGFLSLCTQNLIPTLNITDYIEKPSEAIYVNKRTGTSDTTKSITDVEFDVSAGALSIIKNVSTGPRSWQVSDTARGVNKQVNFDTDTGQSEATDRITAFSSNGFTVGNAVTVNTTGSTFVDWVVREGPAYGLDVVTYTGNGAARTISHNLGAVPTMYWVKNLDGTDSWYVYHALSSSSPENEHGTLDTVAGWQTVSVWNNTAPTSTQFSLGSWPGPNGSGEDFIAHLFTDIPGYCKAFSFVGNANVDGPYIPLGFKPRCWFIKSINGSRNWNFMETAQDTHNPVEKASFFDLPDGQTDASSYAVDACAQGLKIRNSGPYLNDGSVVLVGFAWAEQFGPFANAR